MKHEMEKYIDKNHCKIAEVAKSKAEQDILHQALRNEQILGYKLLPKGHEKRHIVYVHRESALEYIRLLAARTAAPEAEAKEDLDAPPTLDATSRKMMALSHEVVDLGNIVRQMSLQMNQLMAEWCGDKKAPNEPKD